MKKLTDRDLRSYGPRWSESHKIASELLARRAEVRRLRRALVAVTWEHKDDCLCVGCSALSRRAGKGRGK